MSTIDWRSTHSWLRGLSDAKLGKPELAVGQTYDHFAYLRGRAFAEVQWSS